MRAISVRQPYAEHIASGRKTKEFRGARLSPGPILILASKAAHKGGEHLPRGVAVCVVELVRVTGDDGDFAWHFERPQRVKQFEARSFGWIVHVDDRRIRLLSGASKSRASRAPSKSRAPGRASSAWLFEDAQGREIRTSRGMGGAPD